MCQKYEMKKKVKYLAGKKVHCKYLKIVVFLQNGS